MSVQDKDAMDNAILDIKSAVEGTVSVEDATATTINSTLGDTNTKLDDNNTKLDTANSNLVTINGNVVDIETLISTVVNNTLSTLKTTEQAPLDQQVLDETLLNAVTATGASTDIYTIDKKDLTVEITASSVIDGATILIQATTDNTNYGDLGMVDNTGVVVNEINITESGTYYYEIVNASSAKYIRSNITSRIDGTYTVKLLGGAL